MTAAPATPAGKDKSGPQRALEKLGLVRAIDLALHLPMRYEDETRIVPIARLRDGATAQVEGIVRRLRGAGPRRGASSSCACPTAATTWCCASCTSTRRSRRRWPWAQRVRARGEVRGGFFGLEMVHPSFKVVAEGAPLPTALTPVYPTQRAAAAGLPAQGDATRTWRAPTWRSCCRPRRVPPG